ncbi:ribbon-helix-helix domain-containing protein (plasmid) [Anabaena sp. PCC 7938]|jgi:hypothetical protein|uniref:CopG-like ribbon-helix-helix domain-containing protein n=1 Tax=Anabaena cylindrica (strain ATCC 27899 / PCC 7122) TaxID=272123 RepID=K9ZRC9_ANACC|nr:MULTISPECIES: hypothetical protein [Anabaena]AFZ61324.1 hypothetical protein Anacy_6047 [Anabaena cylindrica PCC 7122]MCM2409265.1 hypothetical protein [Anabaena sp. CCAP 1446/1C]BAY06346.1 hypothetical protein NIES19_56290 [Anabaena cylindrica PCC 7122]
MLDAMGTNKKVKITFTCTPELKDELQQWADSENRTLSNLVETLSETAVMERKQTQKAS